MAKRRTGHRGIRTLVLLTVLAVGGMLFYDAAVTADIPSVKTVILERQDVVERVVCAGTVTAGDGVEVYAPMPCVAGTVAVEVGDRVKEGDVLLTIDRTATLAMVLGAGIPETGTVAVSATLPQTVTAPADGVVSAIGAVKGATLATDAPCVVLSNGDHMAVSIAVRETMLPRLAEGQEVMLSGAAFAKKEYKGIITDIASSARSRLNGTVSETVIDAVVTPIEGEVDASWMIGLTAKAAVTVGVREQVLLIPYECVVQLDDGTPAAYCVKNGVAVRVPLTLGEELADGIVVEAGLDDGDTVVVSPEALRGEQMTVKTEGTV